MFLPCGNLREGLALHLQILEIIQFLEIIPFPVFVPKVLHGFSFTSFISFSAFPGLGLVLGALS